MGMFGLLLKLSNVKFLFVHVHVFNNYNFNYLQYVPFSKLLNLANEKIRLKHIVIVGHRSSYLYVNPVSE